MERKADVEQLRWPVLVCLSGLQEVQAAEGLEAHLPLALVQVDRVSFWRLSE